jgi:class 3 adenylate cyclase
LQQDNYLESTSLLQTAKEDAQRWGYIDIANKADMYLTIISNLTDDTINARGGLLRKSFRTIGGGINKTTAELNINANLKLAGYHEKNENYSKAAEYYNKAMVILTNLGEWSRVYEMQEHIAELLLKEGKLEEAMIAYDRLEEGIDKTDDTIAMSRIDQQKEMITLKIDSVITDLEETKSIAKPNQSTTALVDTEDSLNFLLEKAVNAEDSEDFEQSLNYFKEYMALEQQWAEDKRIQEITLLEKVNEIETQEREIKLLKQNEEISTLRIQQSEAELEIQKTFKRNLAIGLSLLAALVLALYFLYRNKRRDLGKLGVAYNDLQIARDQLAGAEKRIKSLLHQQVSGAVADELLASKDEKKVERRHVCIMFLDIRDFTPFAENRKPEEIIQFQNQVFGFMIDIVNKHNGIINQILGDGFMATFGAPVSSDNDCQHAFLAAREIINDLQLKSEKGDIPETKVGIGLHAGYVVAGNVGTRDRKQYSITGKTVILAARLEQLNKEFGSSIVLSRQVYDELPEDLQRGIEFSSVRVKGISETMEVAAIS